MVDISKTSVITVGTPLVSAAALAELHTLLGVLRLDFKRDKASGETMLKERINEAKRTAIDDADEPAVV